jgi:hypothetical protein
LWPRLRRCAERLRDLKITVGSVVPTAWREEIRTATATCTHQAGILSEDEYTFVCDTPVVGRFLNIQSVPGAEILSMCEVEVFAEPGAPRPVHATPKMPIIIIIVIIVCLSLMSSDYE